LVEWKVFGAVCSLGGAVAAQNLWSRDLARVGYAVRVMPAKPLTIVQVSDHSTLGDFEYRVHQPAAALGRLGGVEVFDVHYLSRYRDEAALAADVVVIYLVIDIELFRLIEQRRRLGKPTFCEVNDYFFDVHPWNRAYKSWSDPQNQKVFTNLMSRSLAVQVSSEALAERFRRYNPSVVVFPNHIAMLPEPRPPRQGGGVVVGWGGSAGHLKDIQAVAPALCRWLAAHPEAQLKIMGPPSFEGFFAAAPKDRFRFELAGSLDHYCRFLRTLDVGLAPLLPTDYNRCRSDVKFIEYAAHGVVGVMQRLEPYLGTVRDGENGFLVGSDEELLAALDRLAAAPALRERVARTAHDYVRRERLLEQHVGQRLDFYRQRAQGVKPDNIETLPDGVKRLSTLAVRALPGLEQAGNNYWRLQPSSPAEQRFVEGMEAIGRQDFRQAAAAFGEAVRQAPDYYQAFHFLGRSLWRLGNLVEADRAYRESLRLNPCFSRSWRGLAELHGRLAGEYSRNYLTLNPPLK
jgi:glycosyltransferase involved in cell wall biosynthesis